MKLKHLIDTKKRKYLIKGIEQLSAFFQTETPSYFLKSISENLQKYKSLFLSKFPKNREKHHCDEVLLRKLNDENN